MRVTISHEFACTPETFWRKVFFDPAYNEALFKKDMGFPEYRIVSLVEKPDRIERVVKVTPPQRAPEFVKKLVRGTMSYEETGTYTVADGAYRFKTTPSTMVDRMKIGGTIRAEAVAGGKMNRVVEMDIEVRVMLVGGAVERFLAGEIEASYAKAAAFTVRWIAGRTDVG